MNQLDRGAALINVPDERERVAELNLIAGKRAKIVNGLCLGAELSRRGPLAAGGGLVGSGDTTWLFRSSTTAPSASS